MSTTILRCALGFMRQSRKFRVELLHLGPDEVECAVWWPTKLLHVQASRLWVVIPGGMCDGRDFYVQEFVDSGAIDETIEDWCVFHPAGSGGALVEGFFAVQIFPVHLQDFLSRMILPRGSYKEVVVVGFSLGGILALKTAQSDDTPSSAKFVAVHSPDNLQSTLEEFRKYPFFRFDALCAIWIRLLMRKDPLSCRLSRKKWFRPNLSWLAWITEETWKALPANTTRENSAFEYFRAYDMPSLKHQFCRTLRIQNRYDPIVLNTGLCQNEQDRGETWWFPKGGHCAAFSADQTLGPRLRAWAECPRGEMAQMSNTSHACENQQDGR